MAGAFMLRCPWARSGGKIKIIKALKGLRKNVTYPSKHLNIYQPTERMEKRSAGAWRGDVPTVRVHNLQPVGAGLLALQWRPFVLAAALMEADSFDGRVDSFRIRHEACGLPIKPRWSELGLVKALCVCARVCVGPSLSLFGLSLPSFLPFLLTRSLSQSHAAEMRAAH